MNNPTTTDRFWSKVVIRGADDCWLFTGRRTIGGYGRFDVTHSIHMLAHRFAWTSKNGEIPKGFQVQHRCDKPPCCNPAHLKLGKQKDNAADCLERGRWPDLKGENNNAAKLNPQAVLEMRQLKQQGLSTTAISERFGVCDRTAVDAINGTTWAHIQ